MSDMDLDSSEDEYIETEPFQLNIKCLFCDVFSLSFDSMFDHLKNQHGTDFVQQCRQYNLDTFDFIKVVNHIRKQNPSEGHIEDILKTREFDSDENLKPFLEDDSFLMFDYEGEIEEENQWSENILDFPDDQIEKYYENSSIKKLIRDITRVKKLLNEAQISMEKMKKLIIEDDGDDASECNGQKQRNQDNTIVVLDEQADSDYIDSYSHFSIHHTMLADQPRTLAYQDAILENRSFFKNKTVLDVGCGVGILSLFAAKAGAKLVVAVDQSEIINNARSIIYNNGYENIIKTIKGKLEKINFGNLNLPTKFDIIVSEWMGYFLLFEGMLDTVLFARNNFLQSDGVILPNRSMLFLSALSDCNFYEKNIDFWRDVYGFDMSSMIDDVTSEVIIDLVQPSNICANSEKILDLNITNCLDESTYEIVSKFELKFKNNSNVHGLVGWFDCYFESMSKLIILSTSPFSEPTHWKQTIFPFKEPILVQSGQKIDGEIIIKKHQKNPRSLQVQICLRDEQSQTKLFKYHIR